MSFNIEELKIKLFTNIKDKSQRIVEFTLSMLYHPELDEISADLNQYPYFTFDVKYPLAQLRYLTYKDRVEFFFNKDKFSERLTAYSNPKNALDKSQILSEKEKKNYFKRRDKNIQANIMTMIEILFPTKFPVINDIQTSYDIVMGNSKLKRMVLNPVVTKYFSYLKLNGETYTFKKTIWMNDILNHPDYRKLIQQYRKFYDWSIEEKSRQMSIINDVYPKLVELIQPLLTKESIKEPMKELKALLESFGGEEIQYKKEKDTWKENLSTVAQKYDRIKDMLLEIEKKSYGDVDVSNFVKSGVVVKFKDAIKKYIQTESVFYNTYNDVIKESADIPPEYRNFAYTILNSYRKPQSESTNVDLQDLINGTNTESVKEFYKFMEYLNDKYIYTGKGKPPPENSYYKQLINVGLRYLTTNVTEGVRREIYVYADFIRGEVNDDNYNKIFCPYVSDHLGNEFDFLVRNLMYGKIGSKDTKKWEINRNRMIFTVSEQKSTGDSPGNAVLEASPLPPTADYKPLNIPVENQKKNVDRLDSYFISEILSKNPEVGKMMAQFNKYSREDQLFDQNLLPYIKKNAPDLYSIIADWNENLEKRDQKLLEKMLKLKRVYDGDIDAIESRKSSEVIKRDPNKLNQLSFEIVLKQLYMSVLDGVVGSEKLKNEVLEARGGKSRKYRRRARRYTRKT